MWYHETRLTISHINFHFDGGNYRNSFYCAIKPVLRFAKLFGLFPLNFEAENPQEIRFKWRSLRTAFSLLFMFCSMMTSLMVFERQLSLGRLTPSNIVGIIFFSSCTFDFILFFKIAQKMDILMMMWMKAESNFMNDDYQLPSTSRCLRKRILFSSIGYITLSFFEHFMYQLAEINRFNYEVNFCNQTDLDFVEVFISQHLAFVIENLPLRYNHVIGFVFEYLNFSYTFYWNFLDLFIILISISIAFLFEKINWRLTNLKGLLVSETVWAEIRFHHVKILELHKFVNTLMGEMILFACFVDGYFMLVQLLNITKSLPFLLNKIYFWFSLLFIAFRTTATILAASKIQQNAKYPLEVFRTIPSEGWNEELQRFFNQIKSDTSALSGLEFFCMTRQLLFGLVGALITYELVLLQFDGSKVDWASLINCEKAFNTF